MANENVNHVVINGVTKLDLRSDTATAADVAAGKTFHLASGAPAVGTSGMRTATIVVTGTAHTRVSVTYADVRYYTEGTFIFTPGETAVLRAVGSQGGGTVVVNGDTVATSQFSTASYTLTLPDADVTFTLSYGVTSTLEASYEEGGGGSVTVTALSVTQNGTYTAPTGTAYSPVTVNVSGGASLQAKTNIAPSTSSQTITPDSGYDGLSSVQINAMPTGSATAPASISGTSATVSTGTNTLTLSKTVSVTPSVTAGYVSSGTAGNSSVSLTASVTTQGAQTIYPSTSDQTIAASRYLTGAQTIKAVTTSNLTAENIKQGVTVTVGDSADADRVASVTGTYSGGGGGSSSIGTASVTNSSDQNTSISFTNLKGTPIAFFVRLAAQLTRSSSYSYYYVTDVVYDGTNHKGNYYRRSSGAYYNDTSHYSHTYSGGTLTVSSSASRGAAGGSFYNSTYELTYIY